MKKIYGQKYEVIRSVAQGAMGFVYLVKDLHLNRLFVLKISKCEKELFHREAEILKKLAHPLFPGIVDFFEEDGQSCMVMEYVEGITLEEYLRRAGKADERQAVVWGMEIADGICFLHRQKPEIIYRDLKPANVMIQPDGKVRLIDFGAAFTATYGQSEEHHLMGTPGYSAPEQWRYGQTCKESDIYAFGALMHTMLTGKKESVEKRLPVRLYDRSISRKLEAVIQACLKEQVCDRYHSMEQVKEALAVCGAPNKVRGFVYFLCQAVGVLLWCVFAGRTIFPFLKGVRQEEFPFPYLQEPMLLLGIALLYQILFCFTKKKKHIIRKCEKSIFLTEKKYPGLLMILLLQFVLLGNVLGSAGVVSHARAQEKQKALWVEMRDEDYRKLLLKEDSVYAVTDCLRLEIAKEDLPEGVLSLQIVAASKEGDIYESRVFLIEREQDVSDREGTSKN